jgi:hypothetical protein
MPKQRTEKQRMPPIWIAYCLGTDGSVRAIWLRNRPMENR